MASDTSVPDIQDEARRLLEERRKKAKGKTVVERLLSGESTVTGEAISAGQRASADVYQRLMESNLPGRLLLGDVFQTANPFLWGSVGEAVSTSPAAERAALALEEQGDPVLFSRILGLGSLLGPLGSAAALPLATALAPPTSGPTSAAVSRFAAGQAPLLGLGALGAGARAAPSALQAAPSITEALAQALPRVARGAGIGAATGAGFGALSGLLGEPEGERVEGAVTRALDPLNLGLGALGGVAGPLGGVERAVRIGRALPGQAAVTRPYIELPPEMRRLVPELPPEPVTRSYADVPGAQLPPEVRQAHVLSTANDLMAELNSRFAQAETQVEAFIPREARSTGGATRETPVPSRPPTRVTPRVAQPGGAVERTTPGAPAFKDIAEAQPGPKTPGTPDVTLPGMPVLEENTVLARRARAVKEAFEAEAELKEALKGRGAPGAPRLPATQKEFSRAMANLRGVAEKGKAALDVQSQIDALMGKATARPGVEEVLSQLPGRRRPRSVGAAAGGEGPVKPPGTAAEQALAKVPRAPEELTLSRLAEKADEGVRQMIEINRKRLGAEGEERLRLDIEAAKLSGDEKRVRRLTKQLAREMERKAAWKRAEELKAAPASKMDALRAQVEAAKALPDTPENLATRVRLNNELMAEIQARLVEAQAPTTPTPAGSPTPEALQLTAREAHNLNPAAKQMPGGPPKPPALPPDVGPPPAPPPGAPPPPPGAPPPGGGNIPLPAVEDAMALGQQLMREARTPGLLSRLYRQVVDPAYRTVPHAAEAIRGQRAAYAASEMTLRQLLPALKREYRRAGAGGRNVIDAFIKQMDLTPDELKARGANVTPVEALPEGWRNLFQQTERMQSFMRDKLIEAGYFTPEQLEGIIAMEKEGLSWLHREYRAFADRKWTPPKDVYEKAFTKMLEASNGKLTPDEVRADLHNLMNPGPGVTRETAFQNSRFATSILKERQNLPYWLREFLGEIKDPNFRVAISAAEMERLYQQHVVSETYVAPEYKGTVWDDKPSPLMYEQPIPDNKKSYGAFAGKYVNRQLHEAVMQAQGTVLSNLVNELGGGLTGLFKTSAVLFNHGALVTNFLTNLQFAAAAGLPPWNPMLYKRLGQAATAFRAFQRSAIAFPERQGRVALPGGTDAGAWVKMAIEDGAVKPGFGREAGGSLAKSMLDLYGEMEGKGVARSLKRLGQLYERGKATVGELYDLADQVHRLAVYIEHVTQGRERLGMSMHEARVSASGIVNEFFASAADVGPGVKRVARNVGPLLNPFISWQVDNARVGLNVARAAKTGVTSGAPLPGADAYSRLFSGRGMSPALNVALYRMVVLGGLFAFLKRKYAVSDPEEAVAETQLRAGWAERNPSRTWLPFRDDAGRMQVISLGQMDPWAFYLSGSTGDNWGKRIGVNALKGLTSGSLSERWTEEVLARAGLSRQQFEPRLLPGMAPRAALEDAYRTFTPGSIRQFYEAGRRAQFWGVLGRSEERLTPTQASVRAIFGTQVEPVGSRSAKASELRQLGAESRALVKAPLEVRKLRETPERKGEIREAARERRGEIRERREEIRKGVPPAKKPLSKAERARLIQSILDAQSRAP